MAVQIPTIKRSDAPSPSSVGRIDVKVPSDSEAIARTSNAAANLAMALSKAGEDALDTETNEKVNSFERWYRTKLDGDSRSKTPGLKHFQGNPTEVYTEFDDEALKRIEELSEGSSQLSDKSRIKFKNRLAEKYNSLYNMRLTTYGNQYSTYEQRTTNDSVGLEQFGAVESVGYIKDDDPTTFAPFENNLGNIRNLRLRQGLKTGTVVEDPEGKILLVDGDTTKKVTASNSVLLEIKKDFSDTVFNATKNLINSRRLPSAELMKNKYEEQLDPVNRAKLADLFDKANIEEKAFQNLAGMEDLPYRQQIAKAKGIKDIRVKQEALKMLDANERYKTNIQSKDSKETYDRLANHILTKNNSDEPYDSIYQLESDPLFKAMIGRVTDSRQKKALYEIVQRPTVSNEEVRTKMFDKAGDGSFFDMSANDMVMEMVGLNQADNNYFFKEWKKVKTESDSQERSKTAFVHKEVRRQADAAKLLRYNSMGKPTKKSNREMNDFLTKVNLEMEKLPKNTPVNEITRMVKEAVAKEVVRRKNRQGGVFDRLRRIFTGTVPAQEDEGDEVFTRGKPKTSKSTAPIETSGFNSLTKQQQAKAYSDYMKAHKGTRPPDAAALKAWFESEGK